MRSEYEEPVEEHRKRNDSGKGVKRLCFQEFRVTSKKASACNRSVLDLQLLKVIPILVERSPASYSDCFGTINRRTSNQVKTT